MSKVIIAFNSTKAESLLSYVLAQAYSAGDTIETINTVNMDTAAFNAAIAALTGSQDVAYVALTSNVDISDVQLAALTAKVTDANVIQWQATDRSSAVSMAHACWDYFNVSSAPSQTINYISSLLSKLTSDEQLKGTYLGYSLVAYGNSESGGTVSLDSTKVEDLTNLLDKGILDSNINSCRTSKLPSPETDEDLHDELVTSGQAVYDYSDISDNTTEYIQSSLTEMLTFVLAEQTGAATIDTENGTVAIEVANGTTVTALEPTITLSPEATVSPLSGAATDFTNPVDYTVTAQDGSTTQVYTVTVTVAS